jgi:hypothetical protein
MVYRLVILRRDLESSVGARRLLHQFVGAVFKLFARAIPVHHKAAYVQLPRPGDLLPQHPRIVAGVAHVNVAFLPEPRLINRQQFGAAVRRPVDGGERFARVYRVRAPRQNKGRNHRHREKKKESSSLISTLHE